MARIVNTDNFGGDYPDERFLNIPNVTKEHAIKIAAAINGAHHPEARRYWKVVDNDYELQPGFEP
jgi:hypothetical protein